MKSTNIPERIHQACRRLALRRGFYHLTVDELAREAGVSKRTLYRYYRSKEEIIEATLDAFTREISDDMDLLLQQGSEPAILLKNMFELLADQGRFIINPSTLYDLEKHYPQLWQKIDRFRVERIKQVLSSMSSQSPYLEVSSHFSLSILTTVITSSVQAILNPTFILENGLTFEEAAGQLSQLLIKILQSV